MNHKIYLYFNLACLILLFCKAPNKIEEQTKLDYSLVASELRSRDYYVKVNLNKGIETYVTAYPNTKMQAGDSSKICSLPNLRNLTIDNENTPKTLLDDLFQCDLPELNFISLRNLNFIEGTLCPFSKSKKTHGYLHLTNTNVDDSDLNCLGNFVSIENLSITGPSQKFSEKGICILSQTEVEIKRIAFRDLFLSLKAFNCLLDLKGVETFGFKKIKGRSASDMKKLEDLYFKKNGRKVFVDIFEYDKL